MKRLHQARRKADKACQAERLAKESLASAEGERDRLRTRVDALMAQVWVSVCVVSVSLHALVMPQRVCVCEVSEGENRI